MVAMVEREKQVLMARMDYLALRERRVKVQDLVQEEKWVLLD